MLRSSEVANVLAKSVDNGNGRHSANAVLEGHMPQTIEQTETFENHDQLIGELDVAEFAVLSPTQALFVSALSAGKSEHDGYYVDDGFQIILPDRVWRALGFYPSPAAPVKIGVDTYRMLFDPTSASVKTAYWDLLFSEIKPQIVMEFCVDDDEGWPIVCIADSWLEWPWWIARGERQSCLDFAQKAYEQLFDEINWLELIEQSATTGPKSTLFEGVGKHIAAKVALNDAV